MGGHSSKQSVTQSTTIVASVVQNVTQNCINVVNSANEIIISGNGNVVEHNSQSGSVQVSASCSSQIQQNSDFAAAVKNGTTQVLNDTGIAGTGWLDCGSDDSATDINNKISSSVTANTVQTCLNNINSKNILVISGNQNVVAANAQMQTVKLFSTCILGQAQQVSTVNTVTNTANQQSTYTSKNPFAFITDAIEGAFTSVVMMVAVVFIILVCLAALTLVLVKVGGGRHNKSPPLPDWTAS